MSTVRPVAFFAHAHPFPFLEQFLQSFETKFFLELSYFGGWLGESACIGRCRVMTGWACLSLNEVI